MRILTEIFTDDQTPLSVSLGAIFHEQRKIQQNNSQLTCDFTSQKANQTNKETDRKCN